MFIPVYHCKRWRLVHDTNVRGYLHRLSKKWRAPLTIPILYPHDQSQDESFLFNMEAVSTNFYFHLFQCCPSFLLFSCFMLSMSYPTVDELSSPFRFIVIIIIIAISIISPFPLFSTTLFTFTPTLSLPFIFNSPVSAFPSIFLVYLTASYHFDGLFTWKLTQCWNHLCNISFPPKLNFRPRHNIPS